MNKASPITVIGIDPGYDRVGWAVGEVLGGQFKLAKYGCIETTGVKDIFDRFRKIDVELSEIIRQFKPAEAAIETLFFSSNKTTAMRVSEARGVIISCFFRSGISISEYNPMAMKVAVTGNGKADKSDIARMLHLQFRLDNDKILDDALDAIGMAITHAATRGVSSQLK